MVKALLLLAGAALIYLGASKKYINVARVLGIGVGGKSNAQ